MARSWLRRGFGGGVSGRVNVGGVLHGSERFRPGRGIGGCGRCVLKGDTGVVQQGALRCGGDTGCDWLNFE